MMRVKSIFTIVISIIAFSAFSQSDEKPLLRGGGGGFSVGYGNMDVSELESFLPEGTGDFSSDHLLFGGGGRSFIGNFVIGGSGQGIIGDKMNTDSLKVSLGGGMGTFDFGYMVLNRQQLKIYPMIGIGGGGYGIQISENENLSQEEIQEDPGREISLSAGGFIADVSLNMNFLPIINQSDDGSAYGGPMLGLSVGYTYGWPSSDWGFAGGDISGGPDFNMNMFYVKLTIGGMGFEE